MKLIDKSNRIQGIVYLVLLPIGGVILFATINYFIKDEISEKLLADELRVIQDIEKSDALPNLHPIIEVKPVDGLIKESHEITNDYVYDPICEEEELFRSLHTVKKINGINYSIIIRHSFIETKDLLLGVGVGLIGYLLFISVVMNLANRRILKKIWTPFYTTIDQLRNFTVGNLDDSKFEETEIDEFNILNESLVIMTNKTKTDYRTLKEFTENASHEIQTPLSIMLVHLDEIMQNSLPEELNKSIYKVYKSARRLSRLNENLLLLAKIENGQFTGVSSINLSAMLKDKLEIFEPLFKEKNVSVSFECNEDFLHTMHGDLAEILMDNLLSNAIKHNIEGGFIVISTDKKRISIKNSTGHKVDDRDIFNRFQKGNQSKKSIGLGLSISKRIVLISNLEITVLSEENDITFKLTKEKF